MSRERGKIKNTSVLWYLWYLDRRIGVLHTNFSLKEVYKIMKKNFTLNKFMITKDFRVNVFCLKCTDCYDDI